MNWIGILLLIIHVIACSGLIVIVLLQAGRGASLGAAFGGGSSQTLFGARSATLIGRLTWVLAGVFMATSLLLAMPNISPWGELGAESGPAVLERAPLAPAPVEESAPAIPGAASQAQPVTGGEGEARQEQWPAQPGVPAETPAPQTEAPTSAPDAPQQP
jgi:preprotein translocase subunit SecG